LCFSSWQIERSLCRIPNDDVDPPTCVAAAAAPREKEKTGKSMGPLRKKGRGAGGGKTEALAPGEELPDISPEFDNNKVRSVTMNGRKVSITKSSSSASAAFESLNAASRFRLSVRVSNQRKSKPTSSENTPRYNTSLFCTPETLFLLPMHCVLLPGLGFLIVFYVRAQDSSATELECLAFSKTLWSFFLSVGWVVVFLPVVLGLSSGTRRNTLKHEAFLYLIVSGKLFPWWLVQG
jgi:hypothetical protein